MPSADERCGSQTRSGGECSWPADECPHHQVRDTGPAARAAGKEAHGPREASPVPPGRDLHELAWWLITETVSGKVSPAQGGVIVSAMRVLAGLGEPAETEDDRLLTIELNARLMHGFQPANREQWERARQQFTPEALEEFARWPALDQGSRSAETFDP